jgi:hypothetical protein
LNEGRSLLLFGQVGKFPILGVGRSLIPSFELHNLWILQGRSLALTLHIPKISEFEFAVEGDRFSFHTSQIADFAGAIAFHQTLEFKNFSSCD